MAIYSHCPICGMPLDNLDDVGARKHIDRCRSDGARHIYKGQTRGGRPQTHRPIRTPSRRTNE